MIEVTNIYISLRCWHAQIPRVGQKMAITALIGQNGRILRTRHLGITLAMMLWSLLWLMSVKHKERRRTLNFLNIICP